AAMAETRADRPALMKLRHLEYFVAAAEELNFTHAAGRLHVSQPPFSKQIQDLEGELGVNLFQRERKGVALTYDFLGQTLERWQKVSPGVVVDCVEMDPETQERALLDGRIAVGILV